MPTAVMSHEGSAEHVTQRNGLVIISISFPAQESVVGRSQSDQRFAGVEVVVEMLHLVVGKLHEPGQPDDAVCVGEILQTG